MITPLLQVEAARTGPNGTGESQLSFYNEAGRDAAHSIDAGRCASVAPMRGWALASVLFGELPALACSLESYSYYDPKAVDRGFVSGESPATPLVVESHAYYGGFEQRSGGCSGHDSCEGVEYGYLVLRLRDAEEAERFGLDWGERGVDGRPLVDHALPYEAEDDGIVGVRAEMQGEAPFAFELTAYDADGYASRPVAVEVDRVIDERPQEGCSVGASRDAVRWLLVLGLLLGIRIVQRRRRAPITVAWWEGSR